MSQLYIDRTGLGWLKIFKLISQDPSNSLSPIPNLSFLLSWSLNPLLQSLCLLCLLLGDSLPPILSPTWSLPAHFLLCLFTLQLWASVLKNRDKIMMCSWAASSPVITLKIRAMRRRGSELQITVKKKVLPSRQHLAPPAPFFYPVHHKSPLLYLFWNISCMCPLVYISTSTTIHSFASSSEIAFSGYKIVCSLTLVCLSASSLTLVSLILTLTQRTCFHFL